MTAPAASRGRNGPRGGGHGLSARRRGACDESPRGHHASPERAAHVDPSGRDLGAQPAEHSAAAVAPPAVGRKAIKTTAATLATRRQRRLERKRDYNRSPAGRAAYARYNRSQKGRARSARYDRTAGGRARYQKYGRSERGHARAAPYDASGLGWARRVVFDATTRRVTRLGAPRIARTPPVG
jgi:hypothetical protein